MESASWLIGLFILFAVGFGVYVFLNIRKLQKSDEELRAAVKKPYGPDELRIENAGPGAVIHLTGIGPEMEEFDLKVVSKHVYRSGESTWYELECDRGDQKVWLDMEEDDELELGISLREVKLPELGLSKADLARMDDEEEGDFDFEGRKYYLEDSDRAVFYRHGDDKTAESFYYWDFEASDNKHYIGVERWGEGQFEAFLCESIRPSQVTVYSLK
jgi:hypothetical protein